jgi:hypothetical protein
MILNRTQRTHPRTHSERTQTLAVSGFARNARTLVYALRARHAHVHHQFVNMMFRAYTGVRALRAVRALAAFMRVCLRAVMRAVHSRCVRSRARAFSLSFF